MGEAHNHVGQVSMRQYLMQPRRCGAADLRAWRIDRKRPSDLVPRPRIHARQGKDA